MSEMPARISDKGLGPEANEFPNTSVVGYYDPISQAVNAPSVTVEQLKQFAESPNYFQLMGSWGTILHEVTHWCQHTSTLWGQLHLHALYRAFSARSSNDPSRFHEIATFHSINHRTFFSSYFTTKGPAYKKNWDESVWLAELSCGNEFDALGRLRNDRPILFSRFYTQDKELICRVPFSIASMLETSAVYTELSLETSYALNEFDGKKRDSIFRAMEKRLMDFLYTGRLAIYSNAAHFVANILEIKDVSQAFAVSNAVSYLALNLPDECFKDLKTPVYLQTQSGIAENLKTIKDRGFAFQTIVSHGPKEVGTSIREWISKAVLSAGLDELETIQSLCLSSMNNQRDNLWDDVFGDRLGTILDCGIQNFVNNGILGPDIAHDWGVKDRFKMPPVTLDHFKLTHLSENSFDELKNWAGWYNLIKNELEPQIDEFLAACRQT